MTKSAITEASLPDYKPPVGEHYESCRHLWIEVLALALSDLHGTRVWTPPETVRRSALGWFFLKTTRSEVFCGRATFYCSMRDAVRKGYLADMNLAVDTFWTYQLELS